MELQLPTNSIFSQALLKIEELIKGTEFENHVFACGGVIRDFYLGKTPRDIDLIIDVPNEEDNLAYFLAVQTNSFTQHNPTASPFFSCDSYYEYTSLKMLDGNYKHINIKITSFDNSVSSLLEDSNHRDFSINTLYYNISTHELIDAANYALEDLDRGIILSATAFHTFQDKPINMLRAIRFACELNMGLGVETWIELLKNAQYINKAEKLALTYELNKILVSKNVRKGLELLYKSGLLRFLLPELHSIIPIQDEYKNGTSVWEHTLALVERTRPVLADRMCALLHDIGKQKCNFTQSLFQQVNKFSCHELSGATLARTLLSRFSFSDKDIELVCNFIKAHELFDPCKGACPSFKLIKKFIETVGKDFYSYALDIMELNNQLHIPKYQYPKQIEKAKQRAKKVIDDDKKRVEEQSLELPINGKDIVNHLKIKPSMVVGSILNKLKQRFKSGNILSKEECLKFAEQEYIQVTSR